MTRWLSWLGRAGLACGLVAGAVLPASAQDGADRAFFDSLLVDLGRSGTASQLPGLDRCASRAGAVQRLCQGLIGARRAEYSLDAGEANRARDLLDRTVDEQPKWPVAWYALAMSRVQASRAGVMSRMAALQPMGVSNEYGAGMALIRAISLDSSFTDAIEALAVIPLPREGAARQGERLETLRALQGRLSGMGKYGAGLIELEAGSPDSAVIWFRGALRDPKIDRGMVRLSLARALYRAGQPADGRAILFAGANDTSAASRLAYRNLLAWVASPAELAEWDALAPGAHGPWFSGFWSNRDASEGLSEGARLVEHFKRFDFALKNYPVRELQQGNQVNSSQRRNVDPSRDEVSYRYFAEVRQRLEAEAADTVYPTGMMFAAALAAGTYRAPFRSVRAFRDRLDDRGKVYVRYGAPDAKEEVGGASGSAALWLYNLPDGPLYVAFRSEEFTGSSAPTRMVLHLYDLPADMKSKFCTIRPKLCESLNDIEGGGQAIINTRLEAEAGLAYVGRATTGESFRRQFTKPLNLAVQVAALDRMAGGEPRLLVAFALPGAQLTYSSPPEASGKAVYSVDMQLILRRAHDGKRIQVDTARVFGAPKALAEGENLSGVMEFALQPGSYTGSLMVGQAEGQGALVHLGEFVVPENLDRFTISDVVLGLPGGGVDWNSGTVRVPLNPLNTIRKGSEANVYYQLRGLTPGKTYTVSYDFFRIDDSTRSVFTVSSTEKPAADRMEVSRTVAFPSLDPGRYRVVVSVKSDAGEVKSSAGLTVVK